MLYNLGIQDALYLQTFYINLYENDDGTVIFEN